MGAASAISGCCDIEIVYQARPGRTRRAETKRATPIAVPPFTGPAQRATDAISLDSNDRDVPRAHLHEVDGLEGGIAH